MNRLFLLGCLGLIFLIGCTSTNIEKKEIELMPLTLLVSDFDNFLQVWLENTETDMHRVEVDKEHQHVHVKIQKTSQDSIFKLSAYTGRNNQDFVKDVQLKIGQTSAGYFIQIDDGPIQPLIWTPEKMSSDIFSLEADSLWINGAGIFSEINDYKLQRCRYFDGWLQYPMEAYGDSIYSLRNLQVHDQGGMASISLDGKNYTAEITQLVYGKIIKIMKLAIYDMPMEEIGLNSRSISYTWANPEAKRLGINLRQVISGWTLIEEGYINSTNMEKDNE